MVRALIERSLGEPDLFAAVGSRVAMMRLAQENGVRVPPTVPINANDLQALHRWSAAHGLPIVLKADGTSGGRGVRFAETLDAAADAIGVLSAPPSAPKAVKRALVNRDSNYIRRFLKQARATVSAQAFIAGRDANATVACWKGRVLASFSVSVLQTLGERGPASVVQLLDHADMSRAVHRIVSALQLSGIVGFDFMIEERHGDAYFIELNPRATQMGHLALGRGRDLVSALCSAVSGEALRERPSVSPRDVIALFPQERLRDRNSPFLREAFHDVPLGEPDLIHACLHEGLVSRMWSALSALRRTRSRTLAPFPLRNRGLRSTSAIE
jgi:biotin carboxylase